MSFEQEMKESADKDSFKENRLRIPILKYFWQASPLSGSKQTSIHNFLRNLPVFDIFSDYEIRLFSQFIHMRNFEPNEVVFKEGDGGFGFYLIYSGVVDLYTQKKKINVDNNELQIITSLGKGDYFGELSLLEKQAIRNASAIAKDISTLVVIFKPDLEELIERYPVVAAKFLQAISLIVARRFNSVATELNFLKEKIGKMQIG